MYPFFCVYYFVFYLFCCSFLFYCFKLDNGLLICFSVTIQIPSFKLFHFVCLATLCSQFFPLKIYRWMFTISLFRFYGISTTKFGIKNDVKSKFQSYVAKRDAHTPWNKCNELSFFFVAKQQQKQNKQKKWKKTLFLNW